MARGGRGSPFALAGGLDSRLRTPIRVFRDVKLGRFLDRGGVTEVAPDDDYIVLKL
jgi:hypothetical protein